MHAALAGGSVLELLRDAESVFLALHGGWGEAGHVQALLERAGVRFTGADSAACAAAWHKGRTQAVLTAADVPVTERVLWRPAASDLPPAVKRLVAAGPVVVKPVADGSSVSVHYVDSRPQLAQVTAETHSGEAELIVEPFLSGREFTLGVRLHGQVSVRGGQGSVSGTDTARIRLPAAGVRPARPSSPRLRRHLVLAYRLPLRRRRRADVPRSECAPGPSRTTSPTRNFSSNAHPGSEWPDRPQTMRTAVNRKRGGSGGRNRRTRGLRGR